VKVSPWHFSAFLGSPSFTTADPAFIQAPLMPRTTIVPWRQRFGRLAFPHFAVIVADLATYVAPLVLNCD
jgi:hypothetical protein